MKLDEVRKYIAKTYDRAAFEPLTSTYDFVNTVRLQKDRQAQAYRLADQEISMVRDAIVEVVNQSVGGEKLQ